MFYGLFLLILLLSRKLCEEAHSSRINANWSPLGLALFRAVWHWTGGAWSIRASVWSYIIFDQTLFNILLNLMLFRCIHTRLWEKTLPVKTLQLSLLLMLAGQ